jgi:hypothetical protein
MLSSPLNSSTEFAIPIIETAQDSSGVGILGDASLRCFRLFLPYDGDRSCSCFCLVLEPFLLGSLSFDFRSPSFVISLRSLLKSRSLLVFFWPDRENESISSMSKMRCLRFDLRALILAMTYLAYSSISTGTKLAGSLGWASVVLARFLVCFLDSFFLEVNLSAGTAPLNADAN